MNAPVKLALALVATLSLSSGIAIARSAEVDAGPYGGCPAGYRPGPVHGRCTVTGSISAAPAVAGGCPSGHHLGPGGHRCLSNGGENWVPAGPTGECPAGYSPGTGHKRCFPS
jgi:hypothetical protein